jgi:hypothetical protein
MSVINWGEEFYDHYQRFLKKPSGRRVFEGFEERASIQILTYKNIFEGCQVFASLGLTHYVSEVKGVAEAILITDAGFEHCSAVLANVLFYMVREEQSMRRGATVNGVKNIDKEFYERFGKNSVYFTTPYGFPDGFEIVDSGFDKGQVFLACLITEDESGYLREFGVDRFEDLLEQQQVDIFDIGRPSVV